MPRSKSTSRAISCKGTDSNLMLGARKLHANLTILHLCTGQRRISKIWALKRCKRSAKTSTSGTSLPKHHRAIGQHNVAPESYQTIIGLHHTKLAQLTQHSACIVKPQHYKAWAIAGAWRRWLTLWPTTGWVPPCSHMCAFVAYCCGFKMVLHYRVESKKLFSGKSQLLNALTPDHTERVSSQRSRQSLMMHRSPLWLYVCVCICVECWLQSRQSHKRTCTHTYGTTHWHTRTHMHTHIRCTYQAEIYQLMENDTFPRYTRSKLYVAV
jgi:hypothetical protein